MRMLIIGTCVVFFSGCGMMPKKPEIPEQELLLDEQVHAMSRLEVMNAISECQTVRTRAVVIYGKRKIGGVTRDIVVDVTCAPLY